MTTDATAPIATEQRPIVARAGQYYRVTRYIMTCVLFLYGGWAIYDGFINWPNWPISHPNEKPKSDMDIHFNQVIGVALPQIAILLLIRSIYNSRGAYRLEDGVLYVPGHPPVPLDKIEKIDRELWDRKGIAFIDYNLSSGNQAGSIRLDDFVYDREPTDQIFKAIEESVLKSGDKPEAAPKKIAPVRAAAIPASPAKPVAPPKAVAPAPAKVISPAKPVAPVKPVVPAKPTGVAPPRPPASVPPAAKPASGTPTAPKSPANPAVRPPPPPNRLPPRPRMGP
jgi:hypothetical protein